MIEGHVITYDGLRFEVKMTTTFSLTRLRKLTPLSKNINLWPEPEISIGTWYRKMGRLECWEAIGHAREVFVTLSDEIKDLLGKRSEYLSKGEPIPPSMTFGIYMIGRKKESATPTIFFSCKEAGPRKRAREIILESGILDKHPGIKLGDTTHPPEFDQVPILLATDGMIIDTTGVDAADKTMLCYPSEIIYGRRILVGACNDSYSSLRKATAGGIFVSQGRYFYQTVAHVFAETVEHVEESDEQSFEFDIDGEYSDIDEDSNDFVDTTSRGSRTPSCTDSDETKVSEEPRMDTSSRSQSYSCSSDQMTYNRVASSVVDNGPLMPDTNTQSWSARAMDMPYVLGEMIVSSLDRWCASLDWALIEIKDSAILNVFDQAPPFTNTNESFPCPKRAGRIASDNVNVLAVTSRGALGGTLSGCPTFMKSTGSRTFQEVWTVRLRGSLSNGDCGSWVIDAKTGDLYGHIVSGSLLSGVAYIIPAFQVLESITQCLKSNVELPARPRSLAEQNITQISDDIPYGPLNMRSSCQFLALTPPPSYEIHQESLLRYREHDSIYVFPAFEDLVRNQREKSGTATNASKKQKALASSIEEEIIPRYWGDTFEEVASLSESSGALLADKYRGDISWEPTDENRLQTVRDAATQPTSPSPEVSPLAHYQSTPPLESTRVLHSLLSTMNLDSSFTRMSSTQFSYGPHNVPPFEPTKVLHSLIDVRRLPITPSIQVKMDKGFFQADQDWTCYRRNYFSVVCSYSLTPETDSTSGELYLHRSNVLPPEPIETLGVCISAKVKADGDEGKPIELVQHIPKRDKGPMDMPQIQELSPHPSGNLRGANVATFDRVQFMKATANNGKRRAAQQYFHLLVELYAKVPKGQSESQWVKIASRLSAPLVVRGRSPGHYQDERRNSTKVLEHLQSSHPIPMASNAGHINRSSYKPRNSSNDRKGRGISLWSGFSSGSRSEGLSSTASTFSSDSYDPYDSFDPSEGSSRSSLAEYGSDSGLKSELETPLYTVQPIAELPALD